MKEISSTYFIPREGDKLANLNKRVRILPMYSFPHLKDFKHSIKEHKNRYFIHLDFDSFYAQVEQRDNPSLRGKPVAVGGSNNGTGIVMTSSKEARAMGVDGIMSVRDALKICPDLICLPCCGPKYEVVTLHIREILNRHVHEDHIEQYSIDECFAELTGKVKNWEAAETLARQIKKDIWDEEALTVTLGLSYNKTFAKLSTKTKKEPDSFFVVTPEDKEEKLYHLKVSKLWGIGARIEQRLYAKGIKTVGELANADDEWLKGEFGINGIVFYRMARGEDTSEIFKRKEHEKMLNHHHTLSQPLTKKEDLTQEVRRIGEYLCRKLRAKQLTAKRFMLSVRYPDLSYSFEEAEMPAYTSDERKIYDLAVILLERIMTSAEYKGQVRMFGMTLADLKIDLQRENLKLYEKNTTLPYLALDKLKEKFGDAIIRVGVGRA